LTDFLTGVLSALVIYGVLRYFIGETAINIRKRPIPPAASAEGSIKEPVPAAFEN